MDEFNQKILLIIFDKGLFALALTVVAGLVKWLLQKDQAQRDLVKEIAPKRAEAYEKLWKETEPLCRKKPSELTKQFREEMHDKLNKAYFTDGAAMYLSHKASSIFLKAKRSLIDDIDVTVVIDEISSFRTQLKEDLLIYSKREAKTPL